MRRKTVVHDIQKKVMLDVVVRDVAITMYVLWLIVTDNGNIWIGFLLGYSPTGMWIMIKANQFYGLCRIHKAMIVHVCMVYFCIIYQYTIGFGRWLLPSRWLMLGIGCILIVELIIVQCKGFREWKQLRTN